MITREASTLHILHNDNVRKVAVCQASKWSEDIMETDEEAISEIYDSDSSEMIGKEEDNIVDGIINEVDGKEDEEISVEIEESKEGKKK